MLSSAGTLSRIAARLAERLAFLETRLDDDATWTIYTTTVMALAAVLPHLAPGSHGELLTTAQLAARLQVTPKTLLKRKARGEIRPAVAAGKYLRWRGDELPNGNGNGNGRRK